MNYLNNIKAAIFDLDGTLIDSMYIWDEAASRLLISLDKEPETDLNRKLERMNINQACDYLKTRYDLEEDINSIKNKLDEIIYYEYKHNIKIKEGVKEYIDKLKNIGIKCAVLTASERNLAEEILRKFDLLTSFEFIMTTKEEKLSKDNEEIYHRASYKLASKPKEIIIFEDAPHCIVTAKKVGFKIVGVYDKSFDKDIDNIKKNSDIYITTFKELL